MMTFRTTMQSREATLSIKKEIQDFIIATENLYRLLSHSEALTCHEAEILRCCLEELSEMEDNPLIPKVRRIEKNRDGLL
jgi:hypothetical protein